MQLATKAKRLMKVKSDTSSSLNIGKTSSRRGRGEVQLLNIAN